MLAEAGLREIRMLQLCIGSSWRLCQMQQSSAGGQSASAGVTLDHPSSELGERGVHRVRGLSKLYGHMEFKRSSWRAKQWASCRHLVFRRVWQALLLLDGHGDCFLDEKVLPSMCGRTHSQSFGTW